MKVKSKANVGPSEADGNIPDQNSACSSAGSIPSKKAGKAKKPPNGKRAKPPQASTTPDGTIILKMLPIDKIRPNGWNPNQMCRADLKKFRKEVKRLGRLPKPIVVSQVEADYIIVDGEHGWMAAKLAGLTHVPCEVLLVDRFEAMRQTYVRNRHGTDDPLLLGRLFATMLAERKGLSNRRLAKELGCTEGTIRNHLNYVEAAKVRNGYAPGVADEEISLLNVKQVGVYLKLPTETRNEWLDAGADLQTARLYRIVITPSNETQASSNSFTSKNSSGDEAILSPNEDDEFNWNEITSFDPSVLTQLNRQWQLADRPTRQKFIASVLTQEAVEKAYRTRARTYHPDRGGDTEKFKKLQSAYEDIVCMIPL